jgi:HEAT repeat protein
MAQASEFEGRLMAILHPGVLRRAPSRRIAVGIMAAVVVAAVPLAGLEPRVPAEGADVATSVAADTTEVAVLLRVLGSDASSQVRAAAAWALGQIADPRSTAGLSAAVRDADAGVRVAAVWALQELDDDRALPAFLDALSDASVEVRRMAARGIADLTLDQAPAALLAATADPDSTVRRFAVWALGEIR